MAAQPGNSVRRVRKDAGWRLFLRTVVARAYPRVIGQQRQKVWLAFDVALPLVALSAYVYVYRALGAAESLVGFVILGGAMSAFWMNVLWAMASQLYWEKENGNLALYVMAPGSLMAILLGMALGGAFQTSIRALIIIGLGRWFFDVHFAVSNVPLLVVVFVLALAALYGLGMIFASLFLLLGREAWHLANLIQEPVFLVSGLYFPVKNFPAWVAAGASLIPLTLALDAMRQLAFESGEGAGFLDVRTEAAALAVMSVAFVAGARLLLKRMEWLAISEGRLTESRG